MKEFEKWLKREYIIYNYPPICTVDKDRKEKRQEGWKAALEWVLKEGIDDWIEDTIRKELREEVEK